MGLFHGHEGIRGSAALAAAVVATAALGPAAARAETKCTLRIATEGTDAGWTRAIEQLGERLRGGSCGSIELRVSGETAELTLITVDGRRAVREVAEPFEIAPTVEALLVDFDARALARTYLPSSEPREVEVEGVPDRTPSLAPLPAAKPASNIVLGASLGARTNGRLATPVVVAFGTLASGAWELGVLGQWEVSYESIGADAARAWSAGGFAGAVRVGRRDRVSSLLDFRSGISLAGAVIHQETHHIKPEQWLTSADARIGAYAGCVLPRRGWLRFRSELSADFVPPTGQVQAASPDVPSLPTWAVTLTMGAEMNGP